MARSPVPGGKNTPSGVGGAPVPATGAVEGGKLMDGLLAVADLLGDAPEWHERALCAQTDPEAFFPEKGG